MAQARANTNRIAADKKALDALAKIAGYAPRKPEAAVAALKTLEGEMDAKATRINEVRAELAGLVDDYHTIATTFSTHMTDARDEVMVQFGRNSNEVQSVGRTKTSERKPPVRKPKPTG
ncbi:hypothetical protein [Armatimonas sp.]|uniref:hypothetical protein n=1 Tax=Armatimonas sp. TaxID=1872638 RepID=UPI00286CCF5A|nr:hypothetical protein [Armatimonas sp.]